MASLVYLLMNILCTVVNLASMAVFKSITLSLGLTFHGLGIPGQALLVVLQYVAGILHFALGHIIMLLVKFMFNVGSELLKILLGAVGGVAGAINSGVAGLMEMAKGAWQDVPAKLGELMQSLSYLLDSICVALNNFLESVQSLKDKA